MKNKLTSFLAGILSALLLCTVLVTALAAEGTNLTVFPIQVLVNGEIFHPKDVKGNDVMVFNFNGTTYAPVRALAEAYGLEVGYDPASNLATVNAPAPAAAIVDEPEDKAAQFASCWILRPRPVCDGTGEYFDAVFKDNITLPEFKTWWNNFTPDDVRHGAAMVVRETYSIADTNNITVYFTYNNLSLGSGFGYRLYELSNFDGCWSWFS